MKGEKLVGAEVVDPEVFGSVLFAGFLALEEEDVVGEDDGCGAADLELADDVLEEVELLVAGGRRG